MANNLIKKKERLVVTRTGEVIGTVSSQATSVAASKVANGRAVAFAQRNGQWVWEVKEPEPSHVVTVTPTNC